MEFVEEAIENKLSFDQKEFPQPFKFPKLAEEADSSFNPTQVSVNLVTVSNKRGLVFYAKGQNLFVLKGEAISTFLKTSKNLKDDDIRSPEFDAYSKAGKVAKMSFESASGQTEEGEIVAIVAEEESNDPSPYGNSLLAVAFKSSVYLFDIDKLQTPGSNTISSVPQKQSLESPFKKMVVFKNTCIVLEESGLFSVICGNLQIAESAKDLRLRDMRDEIILAGLSKDGRSVVVFKSLAGKIGAVRTIKLNIPETHDLRSVFVVFNGGLIAIGYGIIKDLLSYQVITIESSSILDPSQPVTVKQVKDEIMIYDLGTYGSDPLPDLQFRTCELPEHNLVLITANKQCGVGILLANKDGTIKHFKEPADTNTLPELGYTEDFESNEVRGLFAFKYPLNDPGESRIKKNSQTKDDEGIPLQYHQTARVMIVGKNGNVLSRGLEDVRDGYLEDQLKSNIFLPPDFKFTAESYCVKPQSAQPAPLPPAKTQVEQPKLDLPIKTQTDQVKPESGLKTQGDSLNLGADTKKQTSLFASGALASTVEMNLFNSNLPKNQTQLNEIVAQQPSTNMFGNMSANNSNLIKSPALNASDTAFIPPAIRRTDSSAKLQGLQATKDVQADGKGQKTTAEQTLSITTTQPSADTVAKPATNPKDKSDIAEQKPPVSSVPKKPESADTKPLSANPSSKSNELDHKDTQSKQSSKAELEKKEPEKPKTLIEVLAAITKDQDLKILNSLPIMTKMESVLRGIEITISKKVNPTPDLKPFKIPESELELLRKSSQAELDAAKAGLKKFSSDLAMAGSRIENSNRIAEIAFERESAKQDVLLITKLDKLDQENVNKYQQIQRTQEGIKKTESVLREFVRSVKADIGTANDHKQLNASTSANRNSATYGSKLKSTSAFGGSGGLGPTATPGTDKDSKNSSSIFGNPIVNTSILKTNVNSIIANPNFGESHFRGQQPSILDRIIRPSSPNRQSTSSHKPDVSRQQDRGEIWRPNLGASPFSKWQDPNSTSGATNSSNALVEFFKTYFQDKNQEFDELRRAIENKSNQISKDQKSSAPSRIVFDLSSLDEQDNLDSSKIIEKEYSNFSQAYDGSTKVPQIKLQSLLQEMSILKSKHLKSQHYFDVIRKIELISNKTAQPVQNPASPAIAAAKIPDRPVESKKPLPTTTNPDHPTEQYKGFGGIFQGEAGQPAKGATKPVTGTSGSTVIIPTASQTQQPVQPIALITNTDQAPIKATQAQSIILPSSSLLATKDALGEKKSHNDTSAQPSKGLFSNDAAKDKSLLKASKNDADSKAVPALETSKLFGQGTAEGPKDWNTPIAKLHESQWASPDVKEHEHEDDFNDSPPLRTQISKHESGDRPTKGDEDEGKPRKMKQPDGPGKQAPPSLFGASKQADAGSISDKLPTSTHPNIFGSMPVAPSIKDSVKVSETPNFPTKTQPQGEVKPLTVPEAAQNSKGATTIGLFGTTITQNAQKDEKSQATTSMFDPKPLPAGNLFANPAEPAKTTGSNLFAQPPQAIPSNATNQTSSNIFGATGGNLFAPNAPAGTGMAVTAPTTQNTGLNLGGTGLGSLFSTENKQQPQATFGQSASLTNVRGAMGSSGFGGGGLGSMNFNTSTQATGATLFNASATGWMGGINLPAAPSPTPQTGNWIGTGLTPQPGPTPTPSAGGTGMYQRRA